MSRRQREMGIRLALGAPTSAVRALVVREGAAIALVGALLGLAGAFATTRTLGTLLYGITARDPMTFAVAAAVLIAIALLASWIPARTVTRIDPIQALRAER